MATISEIKCGKCDRYYSAIRVRCPYCGTMRGNQGKYARDSENMRGKLIIGIAAIAVVIVAVVVILVSANGSRGNDPQESAPPVNTTVPSSVIPSGNVDVTPTPQVDPTPEPSPTPTEIPSPAVLGFTVLYGKSKLASDFTLKRGETLSVTLEANPASILTTLGITPVWTSSNEGVFQVVTKNTMGTSAQIVWIGRGTATLTVTVGDISQKFTVRGGS